MVNSMLMRSWPRFWLLTSRFQELILVYYKYKAFLILDVSARINLGATNGPNKPDIKIPKYINTRVNEVYPVKKSSERCRMLYGKERAKVRSFLFF